MQAPPHAIENLAKNKSSSVSGIKGWRCLPTPGFVSCAKAFLFITYSMTITKQVNTMPRRVRAWWRRRHAKQPPHTAVPQGPPARHKSSPPPYSPLLSHPSDSTGQGKQPVLNSPEVILTIMDVCLNIAADAGILRTTYPSDPAKIELVTWMPRRWLRPSIQAIVPRISVL